MRKNSRTCGFTLIEILIAMLLISFLGGVIYQIFSQGTKLWNRAIEERPDLEIIFFIEKLTADLRNSFIFSNQPFVGRPDSLAFYSLNASDEMNLAQTGKQVTLPTYVEYFPKSEEKNIYRAEIDYSGILSLTRQPRSNEAAGKHILDCKYSYYVASELNEPKWVSRMQGVCLPEAVKVLVEYEEKDKIKTLTKIIPIPHGTCLVK